jgi:hypothetical protein
LPVREAAATVPAVTAPPTVAQALASGARAAARAGWLVPVGFAFAAAERAVGAPATLFAVAVAARGFAGGAAVAGTLGGALEGAVQALASPRALALLAGLWGAGLLLRGALRVLWLAGAVPTLGEALARREAPAFAAGAVWGYPRVLGAALLGFLLEAAAGLSAAGAAVAAVGVSARLAGQGGPAWAAALVALALTAAVAAPILAGLLADAAVCRAALRAEPPLRALTSAVLRLGARPSAFLAVALALGVAAVLLGGSAEAAMGTGMRLLAGRAAPALLAVPQILAGALAAMLGAFLELWRLGAVATLACSVGEGEAA